MYKPMLISEYDKLEADDYVVIQTTSVGLYPNVDDVVIDDETFYKKVKSELILYIILVKHVL